MKKTFTLLVAIVFVLGMLCANVSAARGLTYTAQYGTPEIDGVADDLWFTVADTWTEVDLPYQIGAESICSARVKVMHDDTYIYFLAECTDATIGAAGDCLEFYLDEDNCDDVTYCDSAIQLCINLDGTATKNDTSLSAAEADAVVACAVVASENGYVMEWAYKPLKGMPEAGTVIGMEFMYNDVDEDGVFINALRWNVDTANGDGAPYLQTMDFGDLILAEYIEPEVPEDVPAENIPADETSADAPVDNAPDTADAGILAAAAVMAVAAGVVLFRKR